MALKIFLKWLNLRKQPDETLKMIKKQEYDTSKNRGKILRPKIDVLTPKK